MFLARRPSTREIERFLVESRQLPLSYHPIGIVRQAPRDRRFDEQAIVIGHGPDDFDRARAALRAWKQFDLGWVETFPRDARVEVGTVVAVLIRHLGFWSLNGARVVYVVGSANDESRFGFAYGALTNHAESGEELFEVSLDPATGEVSYRIRAVSRPRAALAALAFPYTRLLQARFRRDSALAVRRAIEGR